MLQLYHGNCLDVMKRIPDGVIDLTVTSPPYDNLRTYSGIIAQWGEHVWRAIIADLFRVTKSGGVVVWIVNDATINGSETGTSFKQALWAIECGFRLHDTMIWDKGSAQYPGIIRYWGVFEYMFVFAKGRIATANILKDRKNLNAGGAISGGCRRPDGRIVPNSGMVAGNRKKEFGERRNIWAVSNSLTSRVENHPAPFPIQLAQDHIVSWSNVGDTVLDPMMGSASTGVAAINTRRNFVGIELNQEYFAIAEKRLGGIYDDAPFQPTEKQQCT